MNKICITCSKQFEGTRKQYFCPDHRKEKLFSNLPEKIFEVEQKNIIIEEKLPKREEKVVNIESKQAVISPKKEKEPKSTKKQKESSLEPKIKPKSENKGVSNFRQSLMNKKCGI